MRAQEERTKAEPQPHGQRLDTAILRDTREFASLEEEWDDLYRHSPQTTPFQSCMWLYSWWESYREGYELRLIVVRDGGLLVGLLPMMLQRRWGFGRLLLIGGDAVTPYKDVLAREGWEKEVAQAGARALEGLDDWWVVDLRELRPEAAAWSLLQEWDGLHTTLVSTGLDDYILIRAKPWEELLASLSKNLRKSARRTLRRLNEDGVRYAPADLGDAEQAACRLVALHRELWRGRRIAPEHLTQRFEALMKAAARRMTARGIGRISEFWRDDAVVISQFSVFDKDLVGAYMLGASQEASQRYQFNTLSIWDAMNVACSLSNSYVSLMDYAIQEKLRWNPEVVPSYRVILGRGLASWIPYAGYHILRHSYYSLRSEALRYALSDSAPPWIKTATKRNRALLDRGSAVARTWSKSLRSRG